MGVDFTTNNDWLKRSDKRTIHWDLIWRFAEYLNPYRGLLGLTTLVALVASAMLFVIPYLFQTFQAAYSANDLQLLALALLGYLVLTQAQAGLVYVVGWLRSKIYTQLSQDVLTTYYAKLINVPARKYLTFKRGTNMFQRVMDARRVSGEFVGLLLNGGLSIILVIGAGFVVGSISLTILAILVAGTSVLAIYILAVSPELRRRRKQKLKFGYPMVSKMIEILNGLMTIKALSGQIDVSSDVSSLVRQHREAAFDEEEYRERTKAVTKSIRQITLVCGMAVGFWLLWTNRLPVAGLFAVYILADAFLKPASRVLESYKTLAALSVNVEKYYEVIDLATPPALSAPESASNRYVGDGAATTDEPSLVVNETDISAHEDAQARSSESLRRQTRSAPAPNVASDRWVSCENVTFGYDPETPVLKDVSFNIAAGEHVALIGRSGVGKTTVMRMLLGFLKPDQGEVYVAEQKISGEDPSPAFRQRLGVVSQDDLLFNVSIRENLRVGMTEFRGDDELYDVLESVDLASHVRDLPQGLDTVFFDDMFSGGQRQRLFVARAMIRRPDVVLLDEPTSSLDFENERAVLDALDTLTSNTTTLTIAHRLATVENADRVIVMEGGRITEDGPHETLQSTSAYYRDFCNYNSFIG